jgi:phage terminase large subunit-like protein
MCIRDSFWIPQDNIDKRTEQDQRVVRAFAEKGHIEITHGNTVDTAHVAQRIMQIMSPFNVRKIGVDPWNATGVTQSLESLGVPNPTLTLMPQSFGTYNEPIKNWLSMLANKTFHHDGNEVLRWMASNAVGKSDPSGNLRFDKGSSSEKIDGMSASAMGMALAIRYGGDAGVYDTSGRGVVLF